MNEITQADQDAANEWQAGYNAGVKACADALEADARLCDCFAREESECGCGAWCEWKSITSARAVEIVRALIEETGGTFTHPDNV